MNYETVEILNRANEIEMPDDRAAFLKNFMKYPLEVVLASYYNDSIEYETFRNLKYKEGPPYSTGIASSTFEIQVRVMYIFRKDVTIPLEKKREVLIQILEMLSKEEQELFLSCIRKKNVKYKNISKIFVRNYFPHILTYNVKRP